MSFPLKIGVFAVLIVGAGSTGTWILWYAGMPEWAPLSKDSGFSSSTYSKKYAEKYTNFLVGVADTSTLKINNGDWWEWSYKKRYLVDTADGVTRTLKGKFAKTNVTSLEKLKEQCKCAYQADDSKVKKDETNIGTDEWYKEDLWKYCSAYPTSPKTVGDEADSSTTYTSGKFGHDNKNKLASTKEGNNDWFWELRSTSFFLSATNPITEGKNDKFKDLYSKKEEGNWSKKIREACGGVYSLESTNVNSYKTDIYKWCSFKGEE